MANCNLDGPARCPPVPRELSRRTAHSGRSQTPAAALLTAAASEGLRSRGCRGTITHSNLVSQTGLPALLWRCSGSGDGAASLDQASASPGTRALCCCNYPGAAATGSAAVSDTAPWGSSAVAHESRSGETRTDSQQAARLHGCTQCRARRHPVLFALRGLQGSANVGLDRKGGPPCLKYDKPR
jgi:hypothetical protein